MPTQANRVGFWLSTLVALGLLAACQSSSPTAKPSPEMAREGRALFGTGDPTTAEPPTNGQPPAQAQAGIAPKATPQASGAWSILIAAFRGDRAAQDASTALSQVRTVGLLPNAYLQTRGPTVVLALGSFQDPKQPEAQAELKRVHELVVNGVTPYNAAFLMPPADAPVAGATPEFDLLKASEKYGKNKCTLEIGFYGRADGRPPSDSERDEFRKAAEQAAAKLRQEGELAFYYHGPMRSSVTVGVFTSSVDFDPQAPSFRSPALADARKRHPYHLFNGEAYRYKGTGVDRAGFKACPLVPIPSPK